MRRYVLSIALTTVAVAAATAGSAGAADPLPQPCVGEAFKDPFGDQAIGPILGGGPSAEGPKNMDIGRVYVNSRMVEGKRVTSAFIEIADMSTEVPAQAQNDSIGYRLQFDDLPDENLRYLVAINSGGEFSFRAGAYDQIAAATDNLVLTHDPTIDITGRVYEGPGGGIELQFPEPAGSKLGLALENAYARTYVPNGFVVDDGPDDAAAAEKTITVTDCPAEQPPAGNQQQNTGTPQQPPQNQPQQPPQNQPRTPPRPQDRQATGLRFNVTPSRDRRPPFSFRTTGHLLPPAGVNRQDACQGRVSVQVKRGKSTISTRRSLVRPDCTFSSSVKFSNRKRLRKSRSLKFVVRFQGNAFLLPTNKASKTARVR